MKNSLKIFVVITIAVFTIISNVNAQTALSQSTNGKAGTLTSMIDNDQKSNTTINTINARAIKDFQRSFKGAVNAKWVKTDEGYIASFTTDGVQTVTAYNFKGFWRYTIRYYNEENLPGDVRDIVKYNYCGYSISTVAEVYHNNQAVYVIYLQDDTHLKIITVCDGDLQEARSYKRG